MSDSTYRLAKVIILAISAFGILVSLSMIGVALNHMAENGHFAQWSLGANYSPDGKTSLLKPPGYAFDTRTGVRVAQE